MKHYQQNPLLEFIGHTLAFGAGGLGFNAVSSKLYDIADKKYSEYLRSNPSYIDGEIDFFIKYMKDHIDYLNFNSDEVIEAEGVENYEDFISQYKFQLNKLLKLKNTNDIDSAISLLCRHNRYETRTPLFKKVTSYYSNGGVHIAGALGSGTAAAVGYHYAKKGLKSLGKKILKK